MKSQLSSILALASVHLALASPVQQESGSKLARQAYSAPKTSGPPGDKQEFICYPNKKSASIANIDIGIEAMRGWEGDQDCSAGEPGAAARMAAGDGYSFYIETTRVGQATSHKCSSAVPDAIAKIRDNCMDNIGDEDRAEGAAWMDGEWGETFVYITGQSK